MELEYEAAYNLDYDPFPDSLAVEFERAKRTKYDELDSDSLNSRQKSGGREHITGNAFAPVPRPNTQPTLKSAPSRKRGRPRKVQPESGEGDTEAAPPRKRTKKMGQNQGVVEKMAGGFEEDENRDESGDFDNTAQEVPSLALIREALYDHRSRNIRCSEESQYRPSSPVIPSRWPTSVQTPMLLDSLDSFGRERYLSPPLPSNKGLSGSVIINPQQKNCSLGLEPVANNNRGSTPQNSQLHNNQNPSDDKIFAPQSFQVNDSRIASGGTPSSPNRKQSLQGASTGKPKMGGKHSKERGEDKRDVSDQEMLVPKTKTKAKMGSFRHRVMKSALLGNRSTTKTKSEKVNTNDDSTTKPSNGKFKALANNSQDKTAKPADGTVNALQRSTSNPSRPDAERFNTPSTSKASSIIPLGNEQVNTPSSSKASSTTEADTGKVDTLSHSKPKMPKPDSENFDRPSSSEIDNATRPITENVNILPPSERESAKPINEKVTTPSPSKVDNTIKANNEKVNTIQPCESESAKPDIEKFTRPSPSKVDNTIKANNEKVNTIPLAKSETAKPVTQKVNTLQPSESETAKPDIEKFTTPSPSEVDNATKPITEKVNTLQTPKPQHLAKPGVEKVNTLPPSNPDNTTLRYPKLGTFIHPGPSTNAPPPIPRKSSARNLKMQDKKGREPKRQDVSDVRKELEAKERRDEAARQKMNDNLLGPNTKQILASNGKALGQNGGPAVEAWSTIENRPNDRPAKACETELASRYIAPLPRRRGRAGMPSTNAGSPTKRAVPVASSTHSSQSEKGIDMSSETKSPHAVALEKARHGKRAENVNSKQMMGMDAVAPSQNREKFGTSHKDHQPPAVLPQSQTPLSSQAQSLGSYSLQLDDVVQDGLVYLSSNGQLQSPNYFPSSSVPSNSQAYQYYQVPLQSQDRNPGARNTPRPANIFNQMENVAGVESGLTARVCSGAYLFKLDAEGSYIVCDHNGAIQDNISAPTSQFLAKNPANRKSLPPTPRGRFPIMPPVPGSEYSENQEELESQAPTKESPNDSMTDEEYARHTAEFKAFIARQQNARSGTPLKVSTSISDIPEQDRVRSRPMDPLHSTVIPAVNLRPADVSVDDETPAWPCDRDMAGFLQDYKKAPADVVITEILPQTSGDELVLPDSPGKRGLRVPYDMGIGREPTFGMPLEKDCYVVQPPSAAFIEHVIGDLVRQDLIPSLYGGAILDDGFDRDTMLQKGAILSQGAAPKHIPRDDPAYHPASKEPPKVYHDDSELMADLLSQWTALGMSSSESGADVPTAMGFPTRATANITDPGDAPPLKVAAYAAEIRKLQSDGVTEWHEAMKVATRDFVEVLFEEGYDPRNFDTGKAAEDVIYAGTLKHK